VSKQTPGFTVAANKCSDCLFSANKIVDNTRRNNILQHCLENDTYFECHKGTIAGLHICCRGFYNSTYGDSVTPVQLAKRLTIMGYDVVTLVNADNLQER